MIQENDFVHFEQCLKVLGPFLDLHSFTPLLAGITDYLEWFIDPCYRFLSPSLLSFKTPELARIPCEDRCRELEIRRFACDSANIFKSDENARDYQQFILTLDRILSIIRHDVGYSPMLFVKICRMFK